MIFEFVTPTIAIVIATLIYLWQKTIDRKTIVASEMRKEYSNYWMLTQEAPKIASTGRLQYGDELARRLTVSLIFIDIYGDPAVYKTCKLQYDSIFELASLSQGTYSAAKISELRTLMELNDRLKFQLKSIHKEHVSLRFKVKRFFGMVAPSTFRN